MQNEGKEELNGPESGAWRRLSGVGCVNQWSRAFLRERPDPDSVGASVAGPAWLGLG